LFDTGSAWVPAYAVTYGSPSFKINILRAVCAG
jgi:hypothetical protein